MAGIGIEMNRIFSKRSVLASVYGVVFSVNYTVGPMLAVMACLLAMYSFLGFNDLGYVERDLFSCSMLYIFIFSLLCSSPFNSVLSKYMTDRIYLERFDDIRPCVYVGIAMNLTLASLVGIPFYLRVHLAGNVPAYYVFTSYIGYLALSLVMAAMVYNSILKHYKRIAKYFLSGMVTTFCLALFLNRVLHAPVPYSMLLAMTVGFMQIAVLEYTNILRNFRKNSRDFRGVLGYFKTYWQFVTANFLYMFGLFAHNFVFWSHPWRLTVAGSYVCNQPYDMASFAAMLTNISGGVLFITQVEMHFHARYADYTKAVIGGRLDSIIKAKNRMFRTLSTQLLTLVERQFVFAAILFLFANVVMPKIGFSGMTLEIYPMLAVGYFISSIMYAGLLFLYYFNDLTGSFICALIFAAASLGGSMLSMRLPVMWYGAGFTAAAFCSFTFIFFRLRHVERNLDYHIFCTGTILKRGEGEMPSPVVYIKHKA